MTFNERNKKYKYRPNGTVVELMDETDRYWKLDNDGTLHVRATYLEGYTSSTWGQYWSSFTKVIFEEPIAPTSTKRWFYQSTNLKTIENIKNLHTENVTDMTEMFYNCTSLEDLNVNNFDTSQVQNMTSMFAFCSNLEKIDVSNFDTSNVTDMTMMFCGCNLLTNLNLATFDTRQVTSTFAMFAGCSSLTKLDLSSFKTSNISSINRMFNSCSSLKELCLGKYFYIQENINIDSMFNYISSDILIKATSKTAERIKNQYPNLKNNFEIIN